MKSKKLKVEYTDDVEVSFDVKCSEIKVEKENKNYRIYGRLLTGGWQLLTTKDDKEKAIDFASNLNPKEYDSKMIIEHNKLENSDFPISLEER